MWLWDTVLVCVKTGCWVGYVDNKADATDNCKWNISALVICLLLLSKRYNSCRVLAFSTIFVHSWRSWACSIHLRSFIFLRSFLTSSSHLCLGLPTGRVIYGYHLCIFFTMLVSGFLYMCPYQLSLWALAYSIWLVGLRETWGTLLSVICVLAKIWASVSHIEVYRDLLLD